jgi:hypothetical protein
MTSLLIERTGDHPVVHHSCDLEMTGHPTTPEGLGDAEEVDTAEIRHISPLPQIAVGP